MEGNEKRNKGTKTIANLANYALKYATGIDAKKAIQIGKIIALAFLIVTIFLVVIVSNLYEIIFSGLGFYDAEDYVEQFSGVEVTNLASGLEATFGTTTNPQIDIAIQSLLNDEKKNVEKTNRENQERINGKKQASENPDATMLAMDSNGKVMIHINDFKEENVKTNYNQDAFWVNKEYATLFSHIVHNYSSDATIKAIKTSSQTKDYSFKDIVTADIVAALMSSTEKAFTVDETDYKVTSYTITDKNGEEVSSYVPNIPNAFNDTDLGREYRKKENEKVSNLKSEMNKAKVAYDKEASRKNPNTTALANLKKAYTTASKNYNDEVAYQRINPYGEKVACTENREVIYTITLKMYENEKDLSPGAEYKNSIDEEDIGLAEKEGERDGYAIEILKEIDAGENGEHGGWGTEVKILSKVTWHKMVKTVTGWIENIKNMVVDSANTIKEAFGASTREGFGGFKKRMKEFDSTYSYRTFIKYNNALFSSYGAGDEDGFYAMLRKAGMTHEGACGLMGNLQCESGFDPNAGSTIGHYGLVQWGDGRLQKLMALPNYETLEVQIDYMFAELDGQSKYGAENDSATMNVLKQNGLSTEQCCYYVMAFYERCPDSKKTGSGTIEVAGKTIKRNKYQAEGKRISAAVSYDEKYKNFDWEHYQATQGNISSAKRQEIIKAVGVSKLSDPQRYAALDFALSKVGLAYSMVNRDGPASYDCSSLCCHSWAAGNVNIRGSSGTDTKAIYEWAQAGGKFVSYDQRKPGDIFLYSTGGTQAGCHHACIYIGNVGGTEMCVNATNEQKGIEYLKTYQQKGDTLYVIRPIP